MNTIIPNPEFLKLKKETSPAEERERKAQFNLCRALGYNHPSELQPGYKTLPK